MKQKTPSLVPLESDEAHTSMQYMQARGLKFTHIKNETGIADKRVLKDGRQIRNFRAMMDYQDGVSPGFPDFAVVLPQVGLLLIELKRADKRLSKVSPAQASWVEALNTCPGVAAHVCYGAEEVIKIIEHYYPIKRRPV